MQRESVLDSEPESFAVINLRETRTKILTGIRTRNPRISELIIGSCTGFPSMNICRALLFANSSQKVTLGALSPEKCRI